MSEKITAMIEEIKGLTVLELSELVHALEEEFGVSAAAMAAPAAGVPHTLKEGLSKDDAEAMKKQVEEAGGKVELK